MKRTALFPDPPKQRGISPKWANLPRRKCDDCGASYKPARPLLEGQRGFCCDNCRKSYHKHGGAYRKLKIEMKKMVEKQFAREFAHVNAELKELRSLWIETESRYVKLAAAPAPCRPNP
jgi:hypothetical protein